MKNLVSVIITTHNRKGLLKRAVDSVLVQTYTPIELIVVDDHSEDGTSEVCKDSRINYIYISKEESRGGNYARNLGIKASNGEYCAFLDDDDYWLPVKIEKQVSLIKEKNCDLVYCGRCLEIVNSSKHIDYQDLLPSRNCMGDMHRRILHTIPTTTSCMMIRRNTLFTVGLFDENLKFWQEYELTIRIAQQSNFYYVNEPLVVYRIDKQDKQRLTNKYNEWRNAAHYVYNKHVTLYKQLSLIERYKVKVLYWEDAQKRCFASNLILKTMYYNILLAPIKLFRGFRNGV